MVLALQKENSIIGCLFGTAVGDALGRDGIPNDMIKNIRWIMVGKSYNNGR